MSKCKYCKSEYTKKKFSQPCCLKPECVSKWYSEDNAKKKIKAQTKKRQSEEKAILKEKIKTLSDWKNDLQKEINLIVRLIDFEHGCIATGSKAGKMNAGHYHSIGSNETLRFHLENIWLQSEHSNMWKSGDTLRYQDGIISLYSKEYLDYLNSLKTIKSIKLTVEDIKEKIPIARSIVKWLRLQDRKFSTEERLSLRKEFNLKLGIYA